MGDVISLTDARHERHEKADANAHLKAVSFAALFAEIGSRIDAALGATQSADDLQLLDAPATAALLAMPVARVFELARRKELGSVRDGRSVRFRRADLAEYQRRHSIAAR